MTPLSDPPDRRTDPKGRERWEELATHFRELGQRYEHMYRVCLGAVIGLTAGVAVLTGAVALGFVAIGDAAEKATTAAAAAKDATEQINDERARNVRANCLDQNDRNESTKAAIPESASSEGRKVTESLIDALAPVRDCEALVAEQVGTR